MMAHPPQWAEGERVACRQCGEWGYETPDDPAPGLCVPCFDTAMETVTREFDAVRDDLPTPEAARDWLRDRLMRAGLTTQAARAMAQQAYEGAYALALAEELDHA